MFRGVSKRHRNIHAVYSFNALQVYMFVSDACRFSKQNMLIWGIWQRKDKPPFNVYFKPFATHMTNLYETAFHHLRFEEVNVLLSSARRISTEHDITEIRFKQNKRREGAFKDIINEIERREAEERKEHQQALAAAMTATLEPADNIGGEAREVEQLSTHMKKTVLSTAVGVLGRSPRKTPDWFLENEERFQPLLGEKMRIYNRHLCENSAATNIVFREIKAKLQRELQAMKDKSRNCRWLQNVFGLTTPRQPQIGVQQHDMHNVQFPAPKLCDVNNQTPADSQNATRYGGTHVQSEASVSLAQSECNGSRCLQPGSDSFGSAFSFLADLLNDDPASVSLGGSANPLHGKGGLQDCALPSYVSASSLVIPVTADSTMTTSWGSKTATPLPNVYMAGSWVSKWITTPPIVPTMD
ncbi:hypothetical protein AWC38_SpisGene16844 [Stylophora pistillata]|uniref:Uncharacterized protein n=1 Tax=Stylophora pistillata TaxID=50429 RepID=A0A2B4RK53_STYPI|nr:hypothetical protein AWC38_SpisGene16844 [Stylophora pistillata]